MNTDQLTIDDLSFIKESLQYTRERFENYHHYPSYEFKQDRLKTVNTVSAKIDDLIRQAKLADR